jgi:hypothetical protein
MRTSSIAWLLLLATSPVAAQAMPPELAALTRKAQLKGSVSAWCRAEFRAGQKGSFAVAVSSPTGGSYIVLDPDGTVTDLGTFTKSGEISCYSRPEAVKLDTSIRESETIHGRITPRWDTTVVCGFLEDTVAHCWQFSPEERAFVKVGQWIT